MAKPFTKCHLDSSNCISLQSILEIFDGPVKEERAWAILYQCLRTCETVLESNNTNLVAAVTEADHVWIHNDGNVHSNSFLYSPYTNGQRETTSDEAKMLNGIGWVIFAALDYGCERNESRVFSPDLEQLIDLMTSAGCDEEDRHQETDDEGIVQDSSERHERISFQFVLQRCRQQISSTASAAEADAHFRAVCRALVAETLEFAQFLARVTKSPDEWRELRKGTEYSSADLGQLHLADWAKLWMQVMRQLRNGVKLKKTDFTRKPIEFELTPYEMLMEDIRSRRYVLRKVHLEEKIPAQIKKDAHAVILEFIRSRPPLKKASERQLPPPQEKVLNPKELLLESIRLHDHRALRPTNINKNDDKGQTAKPKLRMLKADFDIKQLLEAEEEEEDIDEADIDGDLPEPRLERSSTRHSFAVPPSRDPRTLPGLLDEPNGRRNSTGALLENFCSRITEEERRVTSSTSQRVRLPACGFDSVPCSSGSASPLSTASLPGSPSLPLLNPLHFQEEFLQSETFQDNVDCLSLTLQELIHIRRVLTEAELDSLPVDHALKEDLVNSKVCFVCWKTRFSIFKAWGKKCKFCQRVVCAKCCCRVQIPTSESLSEVPVFTLSVGSPLGSIQRASENLAENIPSLKAYLRLPDFLGFGSAPSTPAARRRNEAMAVRPKSLRLETWKQQSLSADNSPKKPKLGRAATVYRGTLPENEELLVCRDCKSLVKHVHRSVQQQPAMDISTIQ